MLTLFNPKRPKRRSKKRTKASRRRRRFSCPTGRYSACSKAGRRRFISAVKKCRGVKKARAAKAYDRKWAAGLRDLDRAHGFNPGRRRRRFGRRRNTSWVPTYANGLVNSVGAGFKPKTITGVVPFAAGALGNVYATNAISSFLPASFTTGYARIGVGTASAGLLAALVGMVAPSYKSDVLVGGVVQVLLSLVSQLTGGGLSGLGMPNQGGGLAPFCDNPIDSMFNPLTFDDVNEGSTAEAISQDGLVESQGMGELNDYLTEQQVANARPLG